MGRNEKSKTTSVQQLAAAIWADGKSGEDYIQSLLHLRFACFRVTQVETPALDGIRGLTGVRLNRGDSWTRP